MIHYRQIRDDDIPALFEIRIATWHNPNGAEELAALGIDAQNVRERLATDHAGWIALADATPVGFAMANRSTGELWVIAVLPEFEGQGIGRELLKQAEAWLFSHGWKQIWLTTHLEEEMRAVGFYRHLGWEDWKIETDRFMRKSNPREVICLEEFGLDDPVTGYARLLRLLRGPADSPHRLCLLLDGEHYWRDMDAIPVLQKLVSKGSIPPMTFALIGHVSGAARHEDYTCNERYSRFIAGCVLPTLEREIPTLLPGGHLIMGLSLSGLMATYLTLQHPDRFAFCLSQSGSHWWQPEWFEEMARNLGRNHARYWLSVGDKETARDVHHPPTGLCQRISQIEGVQQAGALLRDLGADVREHRYAGGHSMKPWREELGIALPWLLRGS